MFNVYDIFSCVDRSCEILTCMNCICMDEIIEFITKIADISPDICIDTNEATSLSVFAMLK